MDHTILVTRLSTYVLIGIAILASIALAAESLPEVKAKLIVIPTLILIIGWTIFHIASYGIRTKGTNSW